MFDEHQEAIAQAGLPLEWSEFRKYYAAIRKAGHYFSNGELEPNLAALAVPLLKADGALLGAISLVTTMPRMAVIDLPKLTQLLTRTAQEITTRIP